MENRARKITGFKLFCPHCDEENRYENLDNPMSVHSGLLDFTDHACFHCNGIIEIPAWVRDFLPSRMQRPSGLYDYQMKVKERTRTH